MSQAHVINCENYFQWAHTLRSLRTTIRNSPAEHADLLRQQYWLTGIPAPVPLPILLYITGRHNATNSRDKVYGILGMSSNLPLDVDYNKSVSQVYHEATIIDLLERPKSIYTYLMYSRPVMARSSSSDPGSASWTLDFSYTHSTWAEHLIDDDHSRPSTNSSIEEFSKTLCASTGITLNWRSAR
jgi:hypothetical protein